LFAGIVGVLVVASLVGFVLERRYAGAGPNAVVSVSDAVFGPLANSPQPPVAAACPSRKKARSPVATTTRTPSRHGSPAAV
jgi:hypothetical protein